MRSDKSFFDFLRSGSPALRIAVLLLSGAILAALAFFLLPSGEEPPDQTDDLTELCSEIEGVGECRVTVSYKDDGEEIYAVAVLCEGAEQIEVKSKLYKLISNLYGLGYNRISVLKISE